MLRRAAGERDAGVRARRGGGQAVRGALLRSGAAVGDDGRPPQISTARSPAVVAPAAIAAPGRRPDRAARRSAPWAAPTLPIDGVLRMAIVSLRSKLSAAERLAQRLAGLEPGGGILFETAHDQPLEIAGEQRVVRRGARTGLSSTCCRAISYQSSPVKGSTPVAAR